MSDTIKLKVLDDGTVSSSTDEISPENHQNADAFLEWLAKKLGGTSQRVEKTEGHVHTHTVEKLKL